MTNFVIENYPVDGESSALRQVVFGSPSDRINVLVSVSEGEDGEEDIEVVIGNGPEHSEALESVAALLRAVSLILDDPDTQEAWLAALEEQNEEENE